MKQEALAKSGDTSDVSEIESETERLLSGRTRDIRLTGRMLYLYEQATWPQRAKIARAWAIWVTTINFLFIPISYLLIPNEFWLSITIGSLVIPAAQMGLYIVWSKPRPAWVEGLSIVVVVGVFILTFGGLGVAAGGVNSERFATGALYFSTVAILIFGVPHIWSVGIAICGISLFFGFEIFNPAIGIDAAIGTTLYYALGTFAVVIARLTASIIRQKSFLMSLRDQYRSKALTKANVLLATQATRDPLTSLANRRFASDSIAKIWNDATVDKTRVAFIMADIDHFKLLNDTAGHAAGDECIQRVAQAIEAASRSGDVVCRYGGEEFLIVLKAVTPAQAWLIAERIRSGVEALGIVNPGLPGAAGITISLGVAFAEPGASPEVVAKWADDALYDAKRTGRNRAFMTRLGPFNEAEKAAAARPAVSSPA